MMNNNTEESNLTLPKMKKAFSLPKIVLRRSSSKRLKKEQRAASSGSVGIKATQAPTSSNSDADLKAAKGLTTSKSNRFQKLVLRTSPLLKRHSSSGSTCSHETTSDTDYTSSSVPKRKLGEKKAAREAKDAAKNGGVVLRPQATLARDHQAKREARLAAMAAQETVKTPAVANHSASTTGPPPDNKLTSSTVAPADLKCSVVVTSPNEAANTSRTAPAPFRLSRTPGAIAVELQGATTGDDNHNTDAEHLVTATLVEDDDSKQVEVMKDLVEEKDSRLKQLEQELAALRQRAGNVTLAEPVQEQSAYHYDKKMSAGENYAMEVLLTGGSNHSRPSSTGSNKNRGLFAF